MNEAWNHSGRVNLSWENYIQSDQLGNTNKKNRNWLLQENDSHKNAYFSSFGCFHSSHVWTSKSELHEIKHSRNNYCNSLTLGCSTPRVRENHPFTIMVSWDNKRNLIDETLIMIA